MTLEVELRLWRKRWGLRAMAEAARTTFEEAKVCPKCGEPGNPRETRPVPGMPRGTKAVNVYCENKKCKWYNSPWVVQVNPDGSIPQPQDHRRTPKHYVGFEGHDEMAQALLDALEREKNLQTRGDGHGEIRNPWSNR